MSRRESCDDDPTALDGEMEKATVWYKCKYCLGFLHSIPALTQHVSDKHKKSLTQLPENLPPEAENGKVYFTYDLPCNKAPATLPQDKMSRWRSQEFVDYCTTKANAYRKIVSRIQSSKTSTSSESDHFPSDYGIRVRQLHDLQDAAKSSEDEENAGQQHVAEAVQHRKPRNESRSPSITPAVSPPDSGIQMHDAGSEYQEDEVQQPQSVGPSVPVVEGSNPKSGTENSSDPQPSTITTAPMKKTQDGKIVCPNCDKKFSNVFSFSFHMKKLHQQTDNTPKEPIFGTPPTPSGKVQRISRITIHRDKRTGNFTTGNNTPDPRGQESLNNQRVREPSSCSEDSEAEDSEVKTVLLRPRRQPNPVMVNEQSAEYTTPEKPKSVEKSRRKSAKQSESESESDDEVVRPVPKKRKRANTALSSPMSSVAPERMSNSESESSKFSPVTPKKRNLRSQAKKPPESVKSDSSNSPIARKTRARCKKKRSPTPSNSNNSTSESDSSAVLESDKEEEEESEGELSDRSTTPEADESLPPPSLTYYGNANNDAGPKKGKKKVNKVDEQNSESTDFSDSSLDNLFIEIPSKKKKKSKKVNGDGSDKSTKPATVENEGETETSKSKTRRAKKDTTTKGRRTSDSLLTCKECGKTFEGDSKYINHLYESHKDNKNMSYNCGYCRKIFTTKQRAKEFNDHFKLCKIEHMK